MLQNHKTFSPASQLFVAWRLALFLLLAIPSGCKKQVEVSTPSNAISSENVYAADNTAAAVLTGIYTNMAANNIGLNGNNNIRGIDDMFLYPSLSADELTLYDANYLSYYAYYTNKLTNSNTNNGNMDYWLSCYPVIYTTNAAIEGLTASNTLTAAVKQQLLGEAKFMRAYCYFYLVNFYGDVPLALTTDYKTNAVLERTARATVWAQIIADLKDAESLLSSRYLGATLLTVTTEKTRPTKWAAAALLAKAYLYNAQWANAEVEANTVISNTAFSLTMLNSVFLKNSSEAIWQIQAVGTGVTANTGEGIIFNLTSSGPSSGIKSVYLSNNVLNSFETGDQRRANWVNSVNVRGVTYYYPYKYKIGQVAAAPTEYSTVFRLAEQYLIRAEARAQQGNTGGAQADLNVVRSRAGLANTAASSQAALLTAIYHERQIELFTEGGNRWLDLKRLGTVDAVMSTVAIQKGSTWDTNQQYYPIPLSELSANPNIKQNTGY